jgi:hypothetical protein
MWRTLRTEDGQGYQLLDCFFHLLIHYDIFKSHLKLRYNRIGEVSPIVLREVAITWIDDAAK